MEMKIRAATEGDLSIIADFQVNLARETENVLLEKAIVLKGLESLFSDNSKGSYFVAEMGGEVVGCHLITFEWSEWKNGNVWWLQSVYIREENRRQGVFNAMYKNLQTLIHSDASVLGLRLYVDKTNTHAQKVYKDLGMNGEHYTVFEWMKE